MKSPPRPLPTWLKWLMRVLGALLIPAALFELVKTGLAAYLLWHFDGSKIPAEKQSDILATVLGEIVGGLLCLMLGIWLLRRSWRKPRQTGDAPQAAAPVAAPTPVMRASLRASSKRWSTCNVFSPTAVAKELWQFSSGSDRFNLSRAERKLPAEPVPPKLIAKDWQTLFQPKLNIAWLPAEKVFLRAVQLPTADFTETISMVELQLEKLSPLAVAQIVWSFEIFPNADPGMQTAIVTIVARSGVEEFLGQLEAQHYLADRLELPFLDQLRATKITEDGVWIYPGAHKDSVLIAWWYGGTLHSLSVVHLPAQEGWSQSLREQLSQMAWAGELEGWFTSPPRYHLVVDPSQAALLEEKVREAVQQPVEVVPSLPPHELAALSALRAAHADTRIGLLPPEYATRYRQQFVDRLWMRGVGAVLLIYVAAVLAYLGLVQFAKFQHGRVDARVVALGGAYTNALQLKARLQVMHDQIELQFAALECWKAAAELMPPELTLESISLERGRTLRLYGSAASEDSPKVIDYNEAMGKVSAKGLLLFSKVNPPNVNMKGPQQIAWNFSCDLKRTDSE